MSDFNSSGMMNFLKDVSRIKGVGIMIPIGRNALLSVRLSSAVAETLKQAAALSGTTLNNFIVEAALQKARTVMDRESQIVVTRNDAAMLLDLLDAPRKQHAARKKAYERFLKLKYPTSGGNPEENRMMSNC